MQGNSKELCVQTKHKCGCPGVNIRGILDAHDHNYVLEGLTATAILNREVAERRTVIRA